jgi:hypothetical protein
MWHFEISESKQNLSLTPAVPRRSENQNTIKRAVPPRPHRNSDNPINN